MTMLPGLQLSQMDAVEDAGAELARFDILMEWKRVSRIPKKELPDWANVSKGGFLLYFPEEKFDDAMTILEQFWGCSE